MLVQIFGFLFIMLPNWPNVDLLVIRPFRLLRIIKNLISCKKILVHLEPNACYVLLMTVAVVDMSHGSLKEAQKTVKRKNVSVVIYM